MKAPATHAAAATAAMLGAGALIAQQVSGKATRDALFLTHLDVGTLPYVMIAAAAVSLAAVVIFSREMVRRTPARAVPAAFGLSAAFLLGEWALSLRAPAGAALALYVHMAVFGAPLISGFWSLVNERFDPYTAKAVVGRIGAGATFGGVLGGAATLVAADLVRASTMLPVLALLNLVTLWAVRALGREAPPPGVRGDEPEALARPETSAFRVLREVRYLRSLAVIIGLGAVAEGLLDFVLKAEADAAFQSGPDLMTFFAAFHTAVGLLAFGVQALFSRPALERLGLAGTVALRPAAVAALGLAGVLFPRLLTATLARGAEAVLSHSLFRSGYELLYTPVPHERKRPAKALVDVGFDRLGMAVGSLLVLAVLALAPGAATRALLALGTAAAVAALLMSRRVHSGYVGTLADNLRSGAVRLDPSDVMDSTTRLTLSGTAMGLNREQLLQQIQALSQSGRHGPLTLPTRISELGRADAAPLAPADPLVRAVADLASGERGRIRRVLAEEPLDTRLAGHIIPLLARDDVFADALQALRRIAPRVTGQLLDALLEPEGDLVVRRRVPRVLKACATQRAANGLVLGLQDERFEVRYPCGLALARITGRNPALVLSRKQVLAAALREIEGDRRMWEAGARGAPGGDPGDRALEHVFTLLALVLEREPLQMAYRALVSADERLRGTALEYLENVLPEAVRDSLWFYLGVRERGRRERPAHQVLDDLRRSMASALGGSRRPGG